MSQERLDALYNELKTLGADAKIAVFAYSEKNQKMVIKLPYEKGDPDVEIASKLTKVFTEVLGSAENQEDKVLFSILRNSMTAAILPYINGLGEEELAAMALLRL